MTRVLVAGGGITGLAAAYDLARGGADVVLVEPGPLGGKLRTTPFDGGALDEAADAFLARVPDAVALCRELGLEADLVSPAARRAYVWSRGALRPLPAGQVLGVPTDLDELEASGLVSPAGLAAVRAEPTVAALGPDDDPAIGPAFRTRLGDEVVDRLVDPLVGGINAGDTDHLSLAATVPQLDAAVRQGGSLVAACRAQKAAVTDPDAPVFHAPRGGMGALVQALAAALADRGVRVVARAATSVTSTGAGWAVVLDDGSTLAADGVVLATPAWASAPVLREVAPRAATLLAAVPHASVALVALAVAREGIERDLDASGYLVPRVEGRTITACSWTSAKWPHQAGDGTVWLRASIGRDGDEQAVRTWDDDAVVAAVRRDLADTMALRGEPEAVRVTRWIDAFPQYRPGHLRRVAAVEADLEVAAPGVVVTGAALRGLGVPACIRQGREAARRLLAHLGEGG